MAILSEMINFMALAVDTVAQSKKFHTMMTVIQKNIRPNMQTSRLSSIARLGFCGLAVSIVSSCSMPPAQAWRQIQREGLIPYVMNEVKSDSAPASAPVTAPVQNRQMVASAPSMVGPAAPSTPVMPTVTQPSPPPPSQVAVKTPVAQAVPGLPGYVRTPFTTPSRLVDVRGVAAGSKVVCPFTQKPFIVPSGAIEAPAVAAAPTPAPVTPAPQPKPAAAPQPRPTAPSQIASNAPATKVAANTPALSNNPPVAPTQPKPSAPAAANNPPAIAEAATIPYGAAVAGRPGFVNSPYAAKHQLVDVTGLPVGMEVKCPYTGKLFRVPPQDQAKK